MIQRIQSLYLLLSVILGTVCLARPIGHFITADNEHYANLFNLWIKFDDGGHLFTPWALFAILVIACALTFIDIFLYKYRALQLRVTSLCMILLLGYYIYFAVFAYLNAGDGSFRPAISAALPFICIVLDYLAFRGILKDELLIRSLNRLR